ncbi:metal dependent phosphohydrolase [Colletotrichum asianum]|uniref:Metal dependent phosphohydrolase n=1 Tax=Colletotrichum asianum TaxID=702518 RepID=A0A8H3ZPH0_9PEZI|nr:metal dependent phosphohydrolase [Colletotrichum asianum]
MSFSLGSRDVLVRIRAASLNPRDLAIINGLGKHLHPTPVKESLIPGSDGAGVVLEVGSDVQDFCVGDHVVTHIAAHLADEAFATTDDMISGLGQQRDGTLCEIGVSSDTALVRMPKSLSFEEAATLTCSGLTAWNALFGHPGKVVHVGDHVLVQGTGGVSMAALQLAIAAGTTVVATTSNQEKSSRLEDIGASRVINYRTTKNWGQAARDLTSDLPPGGASPSESYGMDHVIDIGGYATLSQSILATRPGGVLSVVGASGGFEDKRFEVDGANVAREFIRDQNTGTEGSWTEARIQRSWDAIALHATPSIARHAAKEVALVQMGVLADFFGPRTHEVAGGPEDLITVDEYHAVMRVFPRAGFDGQGMRKILCHLCRTKADTTFDNWVGDFGLTYGTDGEGENLEEYKQGWEKARSASIWTSALESLVTLDQQD